MSNKTKKQQWLEYADAMQAYHEQVLAYAQSLPDGSLSTDGATDSGENPLPPLPPKPPSLTEA